MQHDPLRIAYHHFLLDTVQFFQARRGRWWAGYFGCRWRPRSSAGGGCQIGRRSFNKSQLSRTGLNRPGCRVVQRSAAYLSTAVQAICSRLPSATAGNPRIFLCLPSHHGSCCALTAKGPCAISLSPNIQRGLPRRWRSRPDDSGRSFAFGTGSQARIAVIRWVVRQTPEHLLPLNVP